jgi:hypothetical protein
MQLKLDLGAAGENKKKTMRSSPISGKTYEKFINSLPSNDIVKKRLLVLGRKVPSMTLGYIVDNIHLYISRTEFEIKQEELKIMQENKRYEIQEEGTSEVETKNETQEETGCSVSKGYIHEGDSSDVAMDESSECVDQDQSRRSDVHPTVPE